MVEVKLAQQSDEWLKWRMAGIGSSDAASIMGDSPWCSKETLFEKKVAYLKKGHLVNEDSYPMRRGRRLEPIARYRFERLLGVKAPPLCVSHPVHKWLRASLDGYIHEQRCPLEIKCPGKEDHEKAVKGELPTKYYPQVQHLLLVTGATKCFYVSYSDNPKVSKPFIFLSIQRDESYIKSLFEKEKHFYFSVLQEATK